MGVLRVDHLDILDFIRAKTEDGPLENFNLSVSVTDSFMDAVQKDHSYDLYHPSDHRCTGSLRAGDVFDTIVQAAFRTSLDLGEVRIPTGFGGTSRSLRSPRSL
ncbi:MAG: hypothetical protein U5R49_26640 [Deltaproteobacteria bacterium]|nr:hypothetical protein [Deltaproteobacteria bacterium]